MFVVMLGQAHSSRGVSSAFQACGETEGRSDGVAGTVADEHGLWQAGRQLEAAAAINAVGPLEPEQARRSASVLCFGKGANSHCVQGMPDGCYSPAVSCFFVIVSSFHLY